MCRFQVILCTRASCIRPCGIDVLYCDTVIARQNGKVSKYFALRDVKMPKHDACKEQKLRAAAISDHITCFDCDPVLFTRLERDLATNDGNIAKVLSACGRAPALGCDDPAETLNQQLLQCLWDISSGPSLDSQLFDCLEDMEPKLKPEDVLARDEVTVDDPMDLD